MMGRIWRKILTILFQLFNPPFRTAIMYDIPRIYFIARLKLGKKVHFNDSIFINAVGGVTIGNFTVLSHGTTIISTKNDISLWKNRADDKDIHINEPIHIGNNVWICANVTICSGVKIADNCVIAAGSVVTKSLVAPNCMYGGVPAKLIREL